LSDWLVTHEAGIRVGLFFGLLALLLLLELAWPRRASPRLRRLRWPPNFAIIVIDALVLRLLLPAGAVGTALLAARAGFGLFNQVAAPPGVAFGATLVALDLVIYWQHRVFHLVPFFWRFHRMHHSDVEFDATTALRFHPVEIVVSMFIKMVAVVLLGAPAAAVIVFEVVLNGTAMFNHSNLALPAPLDRVLRWVLVTPDMHRVHHSIHRREHDTNFGFNVPWWDRLFGTYTGQPEGGHAGMTIGLTRFRAAADQHLGPLLLQPREDAARS
jgi:sterol desaturase/sphingolipid hydroxylase (fatty acid hydroxylase superfamily)